MTKEQVYDEQIFPLMAQVIALCKEHKIAHVCSFSLTSEDEGGLACTTCNTLDETEPPEKYKQCVRILYGSEPTVHVNVLDGDCNIIESTAFL